MPKDKRSLTVYSSVREPNSIPEELLSRAPQKCRPDLAARPILFALDCLSNLALSIEVCLLDGVFIRTVVSMTESAGVKNQPNGTTKQSLNFDAPQDGQPAPETDEYGYRIHERPYGTKRRMKVILMGAGASALNFFKQAEDEMQN